MTSFFSVLALIGAGLTAGVMVCVCISLIPAFAALPYDEYVRSHRLFGRYFDRIMPPIVVFSLLCLVIATVRSSSGRGQLIVALVLLISVSLISQLGNVPINRRVKSGRAGATEDPRMAWRRFHYLRTACALASFTVLCGYLVPA